MLLRIPTAVEPQCLKRLKSRSQTVEETWMEFVSWFRTSMFVTTILVCFLFFFWMQIAALNRQNLWIASKTKSRFSRSLDKKKIERHRRALIYCSPQKMAIGNRTYSQFWIASRIISGVTQKFSYSIVLERSGFAVRFLISPCVPEGKVLSADDHDFVNFTGLSNRPTSLNVSLSRATLKTKFLLWRDFYISLHCSERV